MFPCKVVIRLSEPSLFIIVPAISAIPPEEIQSKGRMPSNTTAAARAILFTELAVPTDWWTAAEWHRNEDVCRRSPSKSTPANIASLNTESKEYGCVFGSTQTKQQQSEFRSVGGLSVGAGLPTWLCRAVAGTVTTLKDPIPLFGAIEIINPILHERNI